MKWSAPALGVVLLLCICSGCRTSGGDVSGYETVAADPQRDTESARSANERAVQALNTGDLEEAERELKSALLADTQFGPAHNNLGAVYFRQNNFYMAAWEFEYAAKLMPNHPEPRYNTGLVHESAGKYDDAMAAYEEALKTDEDYIPAVCSLARVRLRVDNRDARTKELLEKIILASNDPEWVNWAREKLALFHSQPAQ